MEQIQGMLSAAGRRVAMVAGRFNDLIVSRLIDGATDCFLRHDGDEKSLTLVRVPGSIEIPLVAGRLAAAGKFDAIVCLGAVIRGDTPHFDYVAAEASKGIASESLRTGTSYYLWGTDLRHAGAGAGACRASRGGNKGWDAMLCRAGDGGPHAAPGLTAAREGEEETSHERELRFRAS